MRLDGTMTSASASAFRARRARWCLSSTPSSAGTACASSRTVCAKRPRASCSILTRISDGASSHGNGSPSSATSCARSPRPSLRWASALTCSSYGAERRLRTRQSARARCAAAAAPSGAGCPRPSSAARSTFRQSQRAIGGGHARAPAALRAGAPVRAVARDHRHARRGHLQPRVRDVGCGGDRGRPACQPMLHEARGANGRSLLLVQAGWPRL
mmetsp:Transcript_9592/g.30320  ORF Transcript_9592/g.30320 Transcript_9592/m.30320 type:complete len:214 (+) Transcript_9592:282-923(+)